jgi:hypothetical protein
MENDESMFLSHNMYIYTDVSYFLFTFFLSSYIYRQFSQQYSVTMSHTQNNTPLPSPTDTRPNSPISNLRRHPNYYLPGGDLYIQVNDTLFRIHSYFFIRESFVWRGFFQQNRQNTRGRDLHNPIRLIGDLPVPLLTTSDTFADFLWVFYNPLYSLYRAPSQIWLNIMSYAIIWGMDNVCDLVYRELDRIVDHRRTTSTGWLTMHAADDEDL